MPAWPEPGCYFHEPLITFNERTGGEEMWREKEKELIFVSHYVFGVC